MTDAEKEVVEMLADAWNRYCGLPKYHPADDGEFCQAIHAAQNIILSRAGRRQMGEA